MLPQESVRPRDLRDYLRVVRHRKWLIVLAMVVITGSALFASLRQTPVYRATARLLLQPRVSETLFDVSAGQNAFKGLATTEIQILRGQAMQDAVRDKLGSAPAIDAGQIGDTNVITVSHESTVPRNAATVANTYAETFIELRRKQAVDDLLAAGEQIQAKIGDLQTQIDRLNAEVAQAPAASRAAAEEAISSQRSALINQLNGYRAKFDQLQVDAALKSGGAQLLSPAAIPGDPIRPNPERTGVMAGIVGLVFGIGLAFLLDYLDDTVKTKEEAERVSGGVPVLGAVPAIPGWKDRSSAFVVSVKEPASPAAEAYRALRTSIQFMAVERPLRTLQVTSPAAAEGKTTTIANLAIALARAGQRVIVVDCDLRRPRLHDFYGIANTQGFTSVLLGDSTLASAVKPVPGEPNVMVLASGPRPPNPSELLSSRRTVEVFTALQKEADIVIVDCPPVLPVTDAALLSSRMDATLLVVTAGASTRRQLHSAVETLRRVNAPIIGTVLNGVGPDSPYGYEYQYQYQYRPREEAEQRNGGRRRHRRGQPAPQKV